MGKLTASLLLASVISLVYSSLVMGQTEITSQEINIIPPSPNATAIQQYVDVPVSFYTGTANLSVPIYTINMGQLSLPINLTYNSSGLKVEQIPSWVGAGWSLNTGGLISRTVRGLTDEIQPDQGGIGGYGKNGFFSASSKQLFTQTGNVNTALLEDCLANIVPNNNFVVTPEDPIKLIDSLASGFIDTEPDLFYYTFPGGSGKFVFNNNREILKYQVDETKITSHPFSSVNYPASNSSTDFSWTFTDAKGIEYTFSRAERIEVTSLCSNSLSWYSPSSDTYQSSWYLTEMKVNGEWIKFYYSTETITYLQKITESKKLKVSGSGAGGNGSSYCTNNTSLEGQRLDSIITSKGEKLVFISQTQRNDLSGAGQLDAIQVYKNNRLAKEYIFAYGYFGTNDKLKLIEFSQKSTVSESHTNVHKFYYNEGSSFPDIQSNNQDYWGYFNGANNISLVPEFKDDIYHLNIAEGANRTPSLWSAQLGTLNKVIYPTGGSSEFSYELNDYYDSLGSKTYTHEASASGGTESNPVTDTAIFTVGLNCSATVEIEGIDNPTINSYTEIRKWNGSSYSAVTLQSTLGNRKVLPAGQYQLFVQHGGDYPQYLTASIRIIYEQTEAKTHSTGGLRVRKIINRDIVSDNTLIKTFKYSLSDSSGVSSGVLFNPAYVGGYATTYIGGSVQGEESTSCIDGPSVTSLNMSAYTQIPMALVQGSHIGYTNVQVYNYEWDQSIPHQPTESTEPVGHISYAYINDKNPNISTYPYVPQADLGYKNGLLNSESVFETDIYENNKLIKSTLYNYAFSLGSSSTNVKGFNFKQIVTSYCYSCSTDMYAYNIYEEETYRYNLIQTTASTIEGANVMTEVTNFEYGGYPLHNLVTKRTKTNSKGQNIVTDLVRDPSFPALVTSINELNGTLKIEGRSQQYNGLLPKEVYEWNPLDGDKHIFSYVYDSQQNIIMKTRNPDIVGGSLTTSYIWGYNQTLPVAKVLNATRLEIEALAEFGSNFDAGTGPLTQAQEDNLRNSLVNAQITTYKYHQVWGAVTEVKDPNRFVITYDYDDFGRLIKILDNSSNLLQSFKYNLVTDYANVTN